MTNEFRGEWGADFKPWTERFDMLLADVKRKPLTVLVWGPGASSSGHDKRDQIGRHLAGDNPLNSVVKSEELMRTDPTFADMHLYEAEQIHWMAADIVIVLIVKGPTGSPVETAIYRGDKQFRDKAWLVVPKLSQKERKNRAFIDYGWSDFPAQRQFEYTLKEYQDCTKIRAFCLEAVKKCRIEQGMEALRQKVSN